MRENGEAHWTQTLDEVGQAIQGCLNSLERYESKFAAWIGPGVTTQLEPLPDVSSHPLEAIDDKLKTATQEADRVERLLDEQDQIWGKWHQSFLTWKSGVEQLSGVGPPDRS